MIPTFLSGEPVDPDELLTEPPADELSTVVFCALAPELLLDEPALGFGFDVACFASAAA